MDYTEKRWNEGHLGYEIGSKAIVAQELADLAKITDPDLRRFALGSIYTSIEHSDTFRYEFGKQATQAVKDEYADYIIAPVSTASMTQEEASIQAREFRVIAGTADFCMTAPPGAIHRDQAKQMVVENIKSLEKITDPRLHYLALNNIAEAAFAQESYSHELNLHAPEVVFEIEKPLHEVLDARQSITHVDQAVGLTDVAMQSIDTTPRPATPSPEALELLAKYIQGEARDAETSAHFQAQTNALFGPPGKATVIATPTVSPQAQAQQPQVQSKPATRYKSVAGPVPKLPAAAKPVAPTVTTTSRSSVRYKTAGAQRQASPYRRPQPGKKKEEEVQKPKKPVPENANPYALGRQAKPTKTRVAAALLTHMAFGITGGYLVRLAAGAVVKKYKKPANKAPESKRATQNDKATNDMTARAPIPKPTAKQKSMRP